MKKRKKMGHRLHLFKGFLMPNIKTYECCSADTYTFFYKKLMDICFIIGGPPQFGLVSRRARIVSFTSFHFAFVDCFNCMCSVLFVQNMLIFNNYWMRLSVRVISRFIQTKVKVICRSKAEADNLDRDLDKS